MGLEQIGNHKRWKRFPTLKRKVLMSTVGTKGPTCFHNRCCWCIGGRWEKQPATCWGQRLQLPQIIFVACKSFHFFYESIYPNIPNEHKYILIIGDEDLTIPRQIDKRWEHDVVLSNEMWNNIVNNQNIIHIFATHLDIPKTNRYSPLPVGFNPDEHINNDIDTLLSISVDTDIMSRSIKIRGCCRIRKGEQWNDRIIVRQLSKTSWKEFSDWGAISRNDFFTEIQKYSFLFCCQGGGLEPNPKVFSAIYCCTIPIVKRFVNCEILYKDLPVIFIEEWKPESITLEKLYAWREQLKPFFSGDSRKQVLEKLTSDYWMKYVLETAGL